MSDFCKRGLLFWGKLFLFLLAGNHLSAQTVSVGNDDWLRELQLQGRIGLNNSLAARPYFTDRSITTDSLYHLVEPGAGRGLSGSFWGKNSRFEVLPLIMNNQFNSHHPYGWNQTGMIQARGWQSTLMAGFYASKGILSVQMAPQLAYAANPSFAYNTSYGAPTKGAYKHAFWGQSSIRLNYKGVSAGISTESLWWGPGINNSLLMSNNAPGFLHFTLNSTKPIKTPIGSLEWQLVSGKMVEDTTVLLENKNLTTTYYNPLTYGGDGYSGPYDPKEKWRYFNGFTITYQPKWVKGLFLGVNRIGYAYYDGIKNGDPNFLQSYFPTIFGIFRQNYAYGLNLPGGSKRYKQMASVHMRYVFEKAHAEWYGEYGWGDNQYSLRDFITDVAHSRAFITGFRKMVPLPNKRWLDCQFELTQMSQGQGYLLRTAGNWYGYQGGYTNQSRIMGAGIGMGNNVQTLSVNWIDGFTRLGVKLERLAHDPDNYPVYWTDESIGFLAQKRWNQLLLNAELQLIESGNYLWEDGNNKLNLRAVIKAVYRLR